jgi:glycosyltransferase involved in cell wall biosynthesis
MAELKSQKIFLSVVSPVYRAEALVHELVEQIRLAVYPICKDFEIILVEDGSPDGSWESIERVCAEFPEVRGVRLSRNFGQHYAISAGLLLAKGDWVVVMDCDLQDQPSEIPRLIQKAKEGFDVVLARRALRQDGFFKKLSSRMFYGTLAWLTGTKHDPAIANFGIYSSKVIQAINSMPESIRYFPTMVRWVGFHSATLDVEHAARPEGKTSYNFKRLLNLALDICLAYSDKPLRLVVGTGFAISLVGFVFAAVTVVQALRGEILVLGYASLIISLWLLSGLMIFIVGVVGLYVGKCFEGVKRRPPFIISQQIQGGGC